ncbi:MAG: hypothetical protein RXR43_11655 [Sulfolobus sp.]
MITEEQKRMILDTLKKEGLEEFFERIITAYDPVSVMNKLLEEKKIIRDIIEKYNNNGNRVAFEKADNNTTFISIENTEEIDNILEMNFEEFISKFKPKMVWHRNWKGTYTTLLGKYRYFAKDYKVVIIRIRFVDKDMIKIATKLSKNIYPLSKYTTELMPLGFVLFVTPS